MSLSKSGTGAFLMEACMNGEFVPEFGEPLLGEIEATLRQPRIAQKYGLLPNDVKAIVIYLRKRFPPYQLTGDFEICQEDPNDNHVIETAIRARVSYLVSDDHHLHSDHVIKELAFRNIKVLRPDEFLDLLRQLD